METLWREFQSVLSSYTSYTKEFYDDYLELRRRDEIDTRLNQSHYHEIAKCTDTITDYRLEINSKKNAHQLNKNHLLEVKKELQLEYGKLKSTIIQVRQLDKNNMRNLITSSNEARKVLERLKQKGSALLQLASICRKYETENQKYTVLRSSHGESSSALPSDKQDCKMETYKNLEQLGHFWDRYNSVRLDCACLMEEKMSLIQENNRLKMRLKNYLVDISMQGPSGSQTLRMGQRPKSMTIEKVECIELGRAKSGVSHYQRQVRSTCPRPVTCIEGNLSVAVRSQKLLDRARDL